MWRIDPQKWSRVIDRFGRPVASLEANANPDASLIAAAPDMFELLENLETNGSVPEDILEEIRFVLSRARGDFGLAFFPHAPPGRSRTREWLKFIEGLWKPKPDT
jgi:hypothetical protein